jgi:hypothetical protein
MNQISVSSSASLQQKTPDPRPLLCDDFFYVFEDERRAHARRAALPLAKPRQNAIFCILIVMREDIDSCVAHKLPAIAASKVAAVRPGG